MVMPHAPPHLAPPPSGDAGGVAVRWVAAAALLASIVVVAALTLAGGAPPDAGDDVPTASPGADEAPVGDAAPAPIEAPRSTSVAPYGDGSPWNTPLAEDAPAHPRSDEFLERIDGPLTSDTSQYTLPVHEVDGDTPTTEVEIEHVFSEVTDDGTTLNRQQATTVDVPLPEDAEPAVGGDAQLVVVDTDTGDEWGFWQLRVEDGQHRATNGYRYNVAWSGVPPEGFGSRGAGLPYLAGLVRPADIERGRIDHAIAFAYPTPSPDHIYPATKSDGPGDPDADLPEGARLRLDPSLDDDDLRELGLDDTGIVIARAMQEYGLILIDIAGRPKIYAEYDDTAGWNGQLTEDTVSAIPIDSFEVIDWEGDVERPVAQPTAPDTVPAGGDVQLDGGASLAPGSEVVDHEWTDVDGRVIGDEAAIRYPTDGLEPGIHRFGLRVADEAGRWSARHHVDVRVEVVDGPHVTGTREATGREVTALEVPDWSATDEDEWLVAAVALRRTEPDDGVEVASVTGAGREWERVVHGTDDRGRVALEVWAAPPGPGPSTDEVIELTTTRATNVAIRGLRVAGAGDLEAAEVAASPDPATAEAAATLSDAPDGLVLGLHAGRTEDVTPEGEFDGDVGTTIVEDEGASVRVTTFVTTTGEAGDAELRASTRSPVEWVLGGLAFSAPEER
jgi:hypothetical protein